MGYVSYYLIAPEVIVCDTCGDIINYLEWAQLRLTDELEVQYVLAKCQCGERIIEAKLVA